MAVSVKDDIIIGEMGLITLYYALDIILCCFGFKNDM